MQEKLRRKFEAKRDELARKGNLKGVAVMEMHLSFGGDAVETVAALYSQAMARPNGAREVLDAFTYVAANVIGNLATSLAGGGISAFTFAEALLAQIAADTLEQLYWEAAGGEPAIRDSFIVKDGKVSEFDVLDMLGKE